MRGDCIVIDIDGTLANHDHRAHLAEAKKWDEFNELCSEDEPNEDVVWLLENCASGDHHIVLLTGRSEKFRLVTEQWLLDHDLDDFVDDLLMRPDGDYTLDHELKPKMLADFFGGRDMARASVRFILEDRDRVVQAWRDLGYNCWQVRNGAF